MHTSIILQASSCSSFLPLPSYFFLTHWGNFLLFLHLISPPLFPHSPNDASFSLLCLTKIFSFWVYALKRDPTSMHRTLEKLPPELRCRNFAYQTPTEHTNRRQIVQKHVCNVRMLGLSFHFAYHHWWLGRRGRERGSSLPFSPSQKDLPDEEGGGGKESL